MIREAVKKNSTIIIGIITIVFGLFIILQAPKLSYELTREYFFPGGSGSCSPDDFDRMVYLYAISFYIVGLILSSISIVLFVKRKKRYRS